MTAAFYNRAQGVVVTFDISQRDSFDNLKSWISDVKQVRFFFDISIHMFTNRYLVCSK